MAGCHSSKRTAKLKQFVALLESGERNLPMHACAREHSLDTDFKGPRGTRSVVDSGSFRQPVVLSGGAVRRSAVRGGTDRSTIGGPPEVNFGRFLAEL